MRLGAVVPALLILAQAVPPSNVWPPPPITVPSIGSRGAPPQPPSVPSLGRRDYQPPSVPSLGVRDTATQPVSVPSIGSQ